MYTGIYNIAGKIIEIHSLHRDVQHLCRSYPGQGTPELVVTTRQSDIDFERRKSLREEAAEGLPHHEFSDAYLETLAVYRQICLWMLGQQGLLFHGSVVAVDGCAYLFTATSGTGKSTHTRMWREVFGERAVMVNDDKPILLVREDGVYACGTPWDGKHHLSRNMIVPLRAICILERGAENALRAITAQEALPMLLQQSFRPAAPAQLMQRLDLLDGISQKVDFYRMQCTISHEAARMAWRAMAEPEA